MTVSYSSTKNIKNSSISSKNSITNSKLFQRNPCWLNLGTVSKTEQKVVGLYRVNKYANFVALLCTTNTGTYTVNWGDGVTETFSSNTQANHEYDFTDADISDDTRGAVTFTDSGDLITRNSHGYLNGMSISFAEITTTTGILTNKNYYVVNATTNTFQVSETLNGPAITLTSNGTGYILPYKQVIITITPTTGNLLTLNVLRKHNQSGLQNFYATGWLDLIISMPNLATDGLTLGGYSTVSHAYLEMVSCLNPVTVTTSKYLFYNCYGLMRINFDVITLSGTAPREMFKNCYRLMEAPPMITTGTTTWNSTFQGCQTLVRIPEYDLSSTTTTELMFYGCKSLTDIPRLNITSTCENAYQMFYACSSLYQVPKMDCTGITNASYMFWNCFSLVKVPTMDLSNCTNVQRMFQVSGILESPIINLNKCTLFDYLFDGCYSLEYVTNLWTTWTGSGAVTMSYMFQNCYTLLMAPDNLNTISGVTDVKYIFNRCYSITKIPSINFGSVTSGNFTDIFRDCHSVMENNAYGATFTHSLTNLKLNSTALNAYYTNLGTASGQTLTVTGNYGVTADDPSIATAKGWTVTG